MQHASKGLPHQKVQYWLWIEKTGGGGELGGLGSGKTVQEKRENGLRQSVLCDKPKLNGLLSLGGGGRGAH